MSDNPEQIYVVTAGEYADYGGLAVFTTRQRAKTFVNEHGDCRIETYPLNPVIFNHCYRKVLMDRDGAVRYVSELSISSYERSAHWLKMDAFWSWQNGYPTKIQWQMEVTLFGKGKERAIKRANGWRAFLLFADLWPEDIDVSPDAQMSCLHDAQNAKIKEVNEAIQSKLGHKLTGERNK